MRASMKKEDREAHLRARLMSKEKIMMEGGEQSLSHTPEDLARIKIALDKLRKGSYGACIDCGAEIPRERLDIFPEAERCAFCQTQHESRLN